jgi:hypothetical protein
MLNYIIAKQKSNHKKNENEDNKVKSKTGEHRIQK